MKNNDKQILPKTAVFVDYECWRFGLSNQYNSETDVSGWFNELKSKGQIEDLLFFGNFEKPLLSKDKLKLRTITNNIIDTSYLDDKKDYTDFIMLDHIYQSIMKNDVIEQYIIFSGDGHFSSVAAFLKNFKDKIVGVYAVNGTLSAQLRDSASWYQLINPVDDAIAKTRKEEIDIDQLIFDNLRWVKTQNGVIPTFRKTVENISNYYNVSREEVASKLSELIRQGTIRQEEQTYGAGRKIKALIFIEATM